MIIALIVSISMNLVQAAIFTGLLIAALNDPGTEIESDPEIVYVTKEELENKYSYD